MRTLVRKILAAGGKGGRLSGGYKHFEGVLAWSNSRPKFGGHLLDQPHSGGKTIKPDYAFTP
jgi:hypothetical protein